MRAIDADALQLAIVEEGQANKRKKYIIGDIWELTGAEIREVINSQPTIQPKRGKWIHHPEIGWGETWLCDQCGEKTTSTVMGKPRDNFCPNCGADMRGEQNE